MNCFDYLAQHFDKIFVLTLSHRKDRQTGILNMLKSIGYDPDNLEHNHKVQFIYATSWPYNEVLTHALNRLLGTRRFTKPNEYDCTRNHYSIVKQGLDLGYEKILVLEDDIQFLKSEYLQPMLESLPDNYDIIRFNGFTVDKNAQKFYKLYKESGVHYIANPSVKLWNAGCYGLSRKGMDYYIKHVENYLTVADMPFYNVPDDLVYLVACLPVAIQVDKDKVSSDIRDKSNDRINYNSDNQYEILIDKSIYIPYETETR